MGARVSESYFALKVGLISCSRNFIVGRILVIPFITAVFVKI